MDATLKSSIDEELDYSLFWKLMAFILVGMISTMFAELWLGFVFIMPGTLLNLLEMIVFYGIHVVFYYNLALRFRRTSFRSLYWWGALFGLYEAWTTTMVYYGYINKVGHLGEVLGIAFYEYFANVFFWHPMNSFILTLMTVQILFYPSFVENPVSETPFADSFVFISKRNKYFWWGYFLYAAGMITSCTYGAEFPLILYYLAFYSSTLLVYFLVKRKISKNRHSPLHLLKTNDKTLGLLGGLIVLYYLFSFAVAVAGEDIYFFNGVFLVIGLFYVVLASSFLWSLRQKMKACENGTVNCSSFKQRIYKGSTFLIIFLGGTLLLWYLYVFITIAWVHVYNPFAFFIIFLTYIFVLTMIKKTGPEEPLISGSSSEERKPFSSGFILLGMLLPLIFSILLRLVLLVAWLFSVFCVEMTMIFGIIFLLVMTKKTVIALS